MWFNNLGFGQNPFDADVNHKLIGYEAIIEEILYNIHAGNMVFIEGADGSGKTSLLKKAILAFQGNGKVAYVECDKIKELNIENVLMGRYSFIERLFMGPPKNMIVLIDDINKLGKKNAERLKYYYDQNHAKAIVFAGENYGRTELTDSLKDRIKKVIKLGELKEYEALDILSSRLNGRQIISDEIAREILARTGNNRKSFLTACEDLCKAIAESKEEAVTMEHVNKLLPEIKKTVEKSAKVGSAKKKAKESKNNGKAQELRVIYEGAEDMAERYY